MSNKATLLVVDDTVDSRQFLTMLLEDIYAIDEAESGEEALQKIANKEPDLVLLDVQMPGMSGYDVCVKLRTQSSTRDLPIIFVSALDSPEERLAGFEAGANDYLIKPIDAEKLYAKVATVLEQAKSKKLATQNANDAMKIAMEAMTVSSELGQIVQFVKEAEMHNNAKAVASALVDISKEFGLEVAVRASTDRAYFVGCKPDSMEAKILNRFSEHHERIVSVGVRTIIRNQYVVMLIRNMPLDDENRYGRVKDHLAVLIDIANGQLATIIAQLKIDQERRLLLRDVIGIAEEQIKKTSSTIEKHDANTLQIMENMVIDLEEMLFGLGLEDDQERRLMGLAEQTSLKLEHAKSHTKDLSSELGVILEKLYSFVQH